MNTDPLSLIRTMNLCPICGNKRCPHANDRRHQCTNSNAPNQVGQWIQPAKPAPAPAGKESYTTCDQCERLMRKLCGKCRPSELSTPHPSSAGELVEAPCMAKLTVFVKEYRGDNAVVFVQTDKPGLPHYPFMVPIRELSHFSAIKLPASDGGKDGAR